jgi:arylsulfatase A-like enzyme
MPKKVILIMTDSQRKDMVGCYGSPFITESQPTPTPNLDRLASEGLRFNRAYTVSPVCGPSRSAIFTGTYPHENGVWSNSMALYNNVHSVGERLSDEGCHTAFIGKWHLDGGDYFGMGQCPKGWDANYWYDMRNYILELSDEDRIRSRKSSTSRDPNLTADFTYAHRCSNRAIDFINAHKDEDYFLVVSYDEPHHPFICPRPFSEMYKSLPTINFSNEKDDLTKKPIHQQAWSEYIKNNYDYTREEFFQLFFGCNAFVDDEIGRVLDAVDKDASDALVIYTSDHGEMMFAHGLNKKGPAMYEEITNIPFIVRAPGLIPANTASDALISQVDITPTILEYFKAEIPPVISGKSLIPVLKDPKKESRDMLFMEFGRFEIDHDGYTGFQPIRSGFDGRYKLVVNLLDQDELYDLEKDPGETTNLIDNIETVKIRDTIHDRIIDWMNTTRDPFRGYCWQIRPWRKDAPKPSFQNEGFTRQREESERYEARQLDYTNGLPMKEATRSKHKR